MKTINKNHIFSKLKLGARRSPECRIFHHLPQSFSGLQTPGCKGTSRGAWFACNPISAF